jgi:hypothetical protein
MSDKDSYDVFLDTWEPSGRLKHAALPSNLNDPLSRSRLFEDSTGVADLERKSFTEGFKVMESDEEAVRGYEFFVTRHAVWSAHFCDHLLSQGMDKAKIDAFVSSFAKLWVDGRSRRQDSREMMAIKAAIRDHDRSYHPRHAGAFVINGVDDRVLAVFTPIEMAMVFRANANLLEALLPEYMAHLGSSGPQSINEVYVRRGVQMPSDALTPEVPNIRRELYYLSSYSLAVGPVEQFAQTWTDSTKEKGIPSIFAAPLPAVQERVVVFAPFIEGMDLRQLELVVAPPIEETRLVPHGEHGGIREFEFE